MSLTEKETLFKHCTDYIHDRISRLKEEITLAQHSANEETKSSMGDKYETSRAMAQLDIERHMGQLKEAEKINSTLQNIRENPVANSTQAGSLITTSNGVFYIAISIGVVKINNKDYFIVSSDSPIGKLFLGKKKGDTIQWQSKQYSILEVQ